MWPFYISTLRCDVLLTFYPHLVLIFCVSFSAQTHLNFFTFLRRRRRLRRRRGNLMHLKRRKVTPCYPTIPAPQHWHIIPDTLDPGDISSHASHLSPSPIFLCHRRSYSNSSLLFVSFCAFHSMLSVYVRFFVSSPRYPLWMTVSMRTHIPTPTCWICVWLLQKKAHNKNRIMTSLRWNIAASFMKSQINECARRRSASARGRKCLMFTTAAAAAATAASCVMCVSPVEAGIQRKVE